MNKLETPPANSDELLMKQYLLGELNEAEGDLLEERFADNQILFERVLTVENELIDLYVQNQMPSRERASFERNYLKTREKRERVETARSLQKYLQNQKAEKSVPRKISIIQKISELFAAPAVRRYATAAFMIVLALACGYLLSDRNRLNNRIAELQNRENSNSAESKLYDELAVVRQRQSELQNRLAEKSTESNSLTGELENERKIRERLEDEIEKIRRSDQTRQNTTIAPELAAITLRPVAPNGEVTTAAPHNQSIVVTKNVKDLSVILILPLSAKNDGRFTVEFNRSPVATNLAPGLDPNGTKILRFVLSANIISRSLNGESSLVTVKDTDKTVISEYPIEFKTQP